MYGQHEYTPFRKHLSERDNYQPYPNGLLLISQCPDGVQSVEQKAGALLAQRDGNNAITGYTARYDDFTSVRETVWDSYYITRVYTLEDGSHIYYLCINQYKLSDVLGTYLNYSVSEHYTDYDNYCINYANAVDSMFRAMKNDDKLAGFILDNRSNSGGYNTDMNFILRNMISEPVTVMETRVKEGIGYTPDYVVNRKD